MSGLFWCQYCSGVSSSSGVSMLPPESVLQTAEIWSEQFALGTVRHLHQRNAHDFNTRAFLAPEFFWYQDFADTRTLLALELF